MAYCTVNELKRYIGATEADDDALLSEINDRVEDIINMRCKRTLVAESTSAKYFTVGRDTEGPYLWFNDVCAAITEVLNGDASATEVTSSQYVTQPYDAPYYGIKILRSSSKVWQYNNDPEDAIKVTANWGWFSSIPDDVKHFSIRLGAFLYRQKDTSMDIDRPLLTDAGVTLLPPDLSRDLSLLVKSYERKA